MKFKLALCITITVLALLLLAFAIFGGDLHDGHDDTNDYDDTEGLAQVLIDEERSLVEHLNRLTEENPEYNYSGGTILSVWCTYYVAEGVSAEKIVEAQNIQNTFPTATIHYTDTVIRISFERNDFTEDVYEKLNDIKDKESLITGIYISFERNYDIRYTPKINKYISLLKKVEFYSAEQIVARPTDDEIDNKYYFINSKEEYDNFIESIFTTKKYSDPEIWVKKYQDMYDEAFFKEKSLIITYIMALGSGAINITPDTLYVSKIQSKIYAVIAAEEPGGFMDCSVKFVRLAIAVNKDDISRIKEVVVLA